MSIFHIHVDAKTMSEDFDRFLVDELGFWHSDFAGHPNGVPHFEPNHHLTQKIDSGEEFKAIFDKVVTYANTRSALSGYVEGEYLALEKEISPKPFDPLVEPPFKFITTPLSEGRFRETEIHITLSRDESDPRLLRTLEQMGFFGAYLPKPYGIAQIFTVQGTQEKIDVMLPVIIEYLEKAGGSVKCRIKEERVARWWTSSPIVSIPPVVDIIDWSAK
jgi:hypothetical protein